MKVIPRYLKLPLAGIGATTVLAVGTLTANAQTIRQDLPSSRITPISIDHHTSPPAGGCPAGTFWDSFLGRCVNK